MKKLLMAGLIVTAINANPYYHNYQTCIVWENKHYKNYWDCKSKYPEEYALWLKADGLESQVKSYALACRTGNIAACDKVSELMREIEDIKARLRR